MRNNRPCPECGSDKKFKNCCFDKKPRNTTLTFMMDEPTALSGYSMHQDGTVTLLKDNKKVEPKSITHGRHYVSESGKTRQVYSMPLIESKLIDINREILNFDYTFAVDTNTLNKKSKKHDIVSIGCVIEAIIKPTKNDNFDVYSVYKISFLNREKCNKPENEVWFEIIRFLIKYIGSDIKTKKIALVVDSDLGNLSAYNNQEIPFIRDVYLPPNITLIHASSDKGIDNIFNNLIVTSDKIANMYFKHLEDGYKVEDFENRLNELIDFKDI